MQLVGRECLRTVLEPMKAMVIVFFDIQGIVMAEQIEQLTKYIIHTFWMNFVNALERRDPNPGIICGSYMKSTLLRTIRYQSRNF